MAQDRIEEKDIFSGDIFAGTKKSAQDLATDLASVATGLEAILKQQLAILEATKVDSAAAIKTLNNAISTQQKVQKGLLAVTKEQEKITRELLKTEKEVIKTKTEDAKLTKELANAEAARSKKSQEAAKVEQEREKIANERIKRVGIELDNKAKAERAAKAEIATREAAERAAKREQRERQKLNSVYAQASQRLAKLKRDIQDLTIAGRTNGKLFKALSSEYEVLNAKVRQADAAVGNFQRNVGNYPSVLKGVVGGFKRLAGALGIVGGFVALGNAIRNAFNISRDFEQRQTTLAAVLQKTRQETEQLSKEAKEYGATTFFTAAQVSELQTELAKLGFTLDEISGATEGAISLAAAFGIDVARAAKVTAGTIRGFNLEANEAGRVADVIASAYSKSAIDIEKFEVAVSKVAPIAQSLNIDLETTTAVLSQLVNANFDASTAGTQFRNILLKLSNSGSNLAGKLGFTVNSSEDLIEAFKQLNKEGLEVADTQDFIDVRSVALLQNIIENVDAVEDLQEAYDNAGGAAKRIADEQLKTLDGAIRLVKSAWEGFVLSIDEGNGIIGRAIKNTLGFVASLLNVASGLEKSFDSVNEELFQSAKANQALVAEGEKLLSTYDALTRRTEDLKNKGLEPTKEESEVLKDTIVKLGDAFGNSAISIDKEKDALKLNREEIVKQIKLRRLQADEEATTLFSRLKGVKDAIKSNDDEIRKAKELLEVRERAAKQAVKDFEETSKLRKQARDGARSRLAENLALVEARTALNDANSKAFKLNQDREDLSKKLEELNFTAIEQAEILKELYEDSGVDNSIGEIERLEAQLSELIKTRDKEILQNQKLTDENGNIIVSIKNIQDEYHNENREINRKITALGELIAYLKGQEKGNRGVKKSIEDLTPLYEKYIRLLRENAFEDTTTQIDKLTDANERFRDSVLEEVEFSGFVSDETLATIESDIDEVSKLKKQAAVADIDTEIALLTDRKRKIDAQEQELAKSKKELSEKEKLQRKILIEEIIKLENEKQREIDEIDQEAFDKKRDFYDKLLQAQESAQDDSAKSEEGALEASKERFRSYFAEIARYVEESVNERNRLELEGLDRRAEEAERSSQRQFERAIRGQENTFNEQEELAAKKRKERLEAEEKAEKQARALKLVTLYFTALDARFNEAAANASIAEKEGKRPIQVSPVTAGTAPLFALADTFTAAALAGQFATGVENFQGKGTETSDSNIIGFSHGESVVTAKGTRENKGLVTAMNKGMVDDYFARVWLPKFEMDNSNKSLIKTVQKDNTNKELIKELKALRAENAARPVQQVHVDSFGNLVEVVYRNGIKDTIKHQGKKWL